MRAADEYISGVCLTRRASAELNVWKYYTQDFDDHLERRESEHTAPYQQEIVARKGRCA